MHAACILSKKVILIISTKSQRLYIEREPEEQNYDPIK